MEKADFALKRGAKIYGFLRSGIITGGRALIGHYETNGEQMRRAMISVMEQADIGPKEVDQIDISANLSGELDRMECRLIKDIFGKQYNDLRVTPLKYLMGDFGGAGIIRAAAVLLSLFHQAPLPGVCLNTILNDGDFSVDWNLPSPQPIQNTLMTSSTFGGGSASMIFTKVSPSKSK